MTDYPHANSIAARMLADGLRQAAAEKGLSVRQLGKKLGYSQAVVLSHMANGRVPIPLDRALDIAREVGLAPRPFLEAVLYQRHPDIDWNLLQSANDPLASELERLAGKPLSALGADHQRVLREAVRDAEPGSRWLAIPEIGAVELFRELYPSMQDKGLTADDKATIRAIAEVFNLAEAESKPETQPGQILDKS